jgi:hypothetical protein
MTDKRLSVIGAAVKLELQRAYLRSVAGGAPPGFTVEEAINRHIAQALANHAAGLAKFPPLED